MDNWKVAFPTENSDLWDRSFLGKRWDLTLTWCYTLTPTRSCPLGYLPTTIIYWTEQQWSEVWVSSPFNGPGHHSINRRPSWAFQKPNNSSLLFLGISISPSRKRSGRIIFRLSQDFTIPFLYPESKRTFLPFPVYTKSYLSAFLKEDTGYWVGGGGRNRAETGQSSWTKSPKYVLKNIFS